ncbi:MAG: alpha/beta hydrolase [Pseudomonadota bacterium]
MTDLPPLPLPTGITAGFVETETGLRQHVLRAGDPDAPLLLLLHGFPELAFSWRRVIVPLAEAGFYVVAPDLRGYGRTTGWTADYDGDLADWAITRHVRDTVALVRALDRESTHATIGHDFGSHVTAMAALLRPDVHQRAVTMSGPFGGCPAIARREDSVHADMLALGRPRKHYQWYYSTRPANADMMACSQGIHSFLRGYFHMKSADWAPNDPHALAGWTATELAKMPTYYIMDAHEDMAQTVARHMPSSEDIASCAWMPDSDMAVFAAEYGRTGFQGGLQSYRCRTSARFQQDLSVFHGLRVQVPMTFLAGRQDWGWAQFPGALDAMESAFCPDYRGTHLIDGAGHWLQQEQPEATVRHILSFLDATR